MLREMGCAYGQGYLFGKAQNAKDTCMYLETLGILPRGSSLTFQY